VTDTAVKPAGKLDPVFSPLPDPIKTQLSTLPEHLNNRDAQGNHLSPRMGRLVRAFRAANGGLSQKALAEQTFKDAGFMTTHCQIATLEQGGCKKGANPDTIKLLAHALKVKPEVISAINEADLKARADKGDEQAKKVLGIEDPKADDEKAGEKASTEKTPTPTPTPAPSAVKKTTSAPTAKPEGAKEKAASRS
jgi:transcriptional regulator with XRE-family HTH domain